MLEPPISTEISKSVSPDGVPEGVGVPGGVGDGVGVPGGVGVGVGVGVPPVELSEADSLIDTREVSDFLIVKVADPS